MKRVLSIDFDYFLDTDIDTRNNKFPDGVDDKSNTILEKEWNYFYTEYPEIKEIGLIEEFENTLRALRHWLPQFIDGEPVKVFIADSHKWIKKVFDEEPEEDLDVTHIDFHHDCYISGGLELDCANWVRILKDLLSPNSKVKWIRREDSDIHSLFGEFPYEHTTEFGMLPAYDYIFICFSPEWTPPHLKTQFDRLCESVQRFNPIYL